MFKTIKKIKYFYVFLIIFLFFIFLLSRGCIYDKKDLSYGITFSLKQAESLGLDWQEAYASILDDLKIKKIRLAAYWDEIEAEKDSYVWEDLDWQIKKASEVGVEIILAVGGRLPRWPECHFPKWLENVSQVEKREQLLEYIELTINRYKDNKNIAAWQVENEPFLINFGECPKLDKDLLDEEIALVKSLDKRPIVVTDSGELSAWIPAARRADIFGTTMYRDTYSKLLRSYVHYPIEPGFFRFKKNITRIFSDPEKWVVIELQAEPWGSVPFQELPKTERDITMSLEKFKDMIDFSRKTGFKEFYLWGVEWWYWEWKVNGDKRFWEEAWKLFN
ncbi:MAG: cellulase family glycosylhydrolase [Patescibacteria group bacterium]|nr:cellulase family glycosylhydrolase [Patescibacteria group bacterium]